MALDDRARTTGALPRDQGEAASARGVSSTLAPDRALDKAGLSRNARGTRWASSLLAGDATAALAEVTRRRLHAQDAPDLPGLEIVLRLRLDDFDGAHACAADHWQSSGPAGGDETSPLPIPRDGSGNARFPTLQPRAPEWTRGKREEPRFCVYTSLYGRYDSLGPPLYRPDGVDFVCFTDSSEPQAGWTSVRLDLGAADPVIDSRYSKMLPHRLLKDYDCSLYIDANQIILGDIGEFCRTWLFGRPFVGWAHPERSDIYRELEANLLRLRHEPHSVIEEYRRYRQEGVPNDTGLLEAALLWRDHRDPDVARLMELWWREYGRYSRRDQPVLSYCMWKTGIHPQALPQELGNCRGSDITGKAPHTLGAPVARDRRRGTVRERPAASRRKAVAWLYWEPGGRVASTVMRGAQLASFAKEALSEEYDFSYRPYSDAMDSVPPIVVLTKALLKVISPDQLAALRGKGAELVCADYVDAPVREDLGDLIDCYIASSIRQLLHLRRAHRGKLVRLVTHHVDPEIENIAVPTEYINIGYFGEIANARFSKELQGVIDFCLTNTKVSDKVWINRLNHCNMHYAVREGRPFDGFKPFLKGFTAAHCHSNIIVPRAESDAVYYLGRDYPFMIEQGSLHEVEAMIDFARGAFGGPLWQEGLRRMEVVRQRSSREHIQQEVRELLCCL